MATGIQQHDVWMAADALVREGEQPTIEKVRLYLGRGSPNTVGPHLKAWFRTLGERLDGGRGQGTLPEAVARAAQALWQAAQEEAAEAAQQAVAAQREALAQAEAELGVQRQALADERARLAAREADLAQATQAAVAHAVAAQESERSVRTELAARQQELRAERRESTRLAEANQGLQAELRGAAQAHRDALAAAEARHAAHERRWLTELDQARTQMRKRQAGHAELLVRHADTEKALAAAARAHEQARAAWTAERGRLEAQSEQAGRAARQAQVDAAFLRERFAEQASQAEAAAQAAERREQVLQARLDALAAQMQEKERQLSWLMRLTAEREAVPEADDARESGPAQPRGEPE